MPLSIREIQQGLRKKGFVAENKHHQLYRLELEGEITSIRTMISHGSKKKDYGEELISRMRRQLKLDTKSQLVDLVKCPMTFDEYVAHLRTIKAI